MIKIFLSYAHEDAAAAEHLYRALNAYPRVEVWFDKHSLPGGSNWAPAIRKAIRECRYCIVLLSKHAVTKRGFYQKEIRAALDVLREFPEDETFVVPVRLDDCEVRFEALRELQYIDLFQTGGMDSTVYSALFSFTRVSLRLRARHCYV